MATRPPFAAKKSAKPKGDGETAGQVRKEMAFMKKGGAPKALLGKEQAELKSAKRK